MSSSYTVRVAFVDDSYWDDGSRWTSQTFKFKNQQEAIDFAREAVKKGCTLKGQCAEVRTRPRADDVTVERHSVTRVKWQSE